MRNNDVLKVAGVVFVAVGLFGVYGASAAKPEKVRICHATASASNPYTSIKVDTDAIDGAGSNDHSSHSGDIIPPVVGVTVGLNWTTAGQAIWNNDCNKVIVEETSTTVEETSTTVGEVGVADIALDKQASTDNAVAGAEISYDIIAHNTGGLALQQPVITDRLPLEVTLSTWSIEDDGGNCVLEVATPPQVVTCTMSDPLPIDGFTKKITLTVNVDANLAVDALVQNQAKVVAAYLPPNQPAGESFGARRIQIVLDGLSCTPLPVNSVCALSGKVTTSATAAVTTTSASGNNPPAPTTAQGSQGSLPSTGRSSGGVWYLASWLVGLGCFVVATARRPKRT